MFLAVFQYINNYFVYWCNFKILDKTSTKFFSYKIIVLKTRANKDFVHVKK